jgi:hypothetical protein
MGEHQKFWQAVWHGTARDMRMAWTGFLIGALYGGLIIEVIIALFVRH